MIIKLVARMTECYFYVCLFLGFLTSIVTCVWCVLKSWNLFVNSKGEFLEWLKVWKCKEYISKNYRLVRVGFVKNVFWNLATTRILKVLERELERSL